jgi:hypothetical protein
MQQQQMQHATEPGRGTRRTDGGGSTSNQTGMMLLLAGWRRWLPHRNRLNLSPTVMPSGVLPAGVCESDIRVQRLSLRSTASMPPVYRS